MVDITGNVVLASVVPSGTLTVQSVVGKVVLAPVITTGRLRAQGLTGRVSLAPIIVRAELDTVREGDGYFRTDLRESYLSFEENVIFGYSTDTLTIPAKLPQVLTFTIRNQDGTLGSVFFDAGSRIVMGVLADAKNRFFSGPVLEFNVTTGRVRMNVTVARGSGQASSWVAYQSAAPATGDPLADPLLMHAFAGGM